MTEPSESPRTLALTCLKQLAATPGQFEEVAQRYRMPPEYVRQGVTLIQQAIDLVNHAESCAQLDVLLNAIHAVAPHLTKLPSALKNPYLGLSAFRQQHAAQFFGRETEITALHDMVKQRAFVAVIGNSGSGKSSLVFAGLIPKLSDWRIIECRPKDRCAPTVAPTKIWCLHTCAV